MSERRPWKSTEDNPYYSFYGQEHLPEGFRFAEQNIVTLDDCAKHRDTWQECVKTIEVPENANKTKLHNCNDYFSKYQFCMVTYRAQKELNLSRWHCHKEQDEAIKVCSDGNFLSRACHQANQKIEDCLIKQKKINQEKEMFQTKTYKDW